jgi:hypothetical protein
LLFFFSVCAHRESPFPTPSTPPPTVTVNRAWLARCWPWGKGPLLLAHISGREIRGLRSIYRVNMAGSSQPPLKKYNHLKFAQFFPFRGDLMGPLTAGWTVKNGWGGEGLAGLWLIGCWRFGASAIYLHVRQGKNRKLGDWGVSTEQIWQVTNEPHWHH